MVEANELDLELMEAMSKSLREDVDSVLNNLSNDYAIDHYEEVFQDWNNFLSEVEGKGFAHLVKGMLSLVKTTTGYMEDFKKYGK